MEMEDPLAAQQQQHQQPPPEQFCSYAVTGSNDAFQAIFVCRTCCCGIGSTPLLDGTTPLTQTQPSRCVCQACADSCHAEHDIEYIGMGPCYCDCRELGGPTCSILASSRVEARRLGLATNDDNNNNNGPRDAAIFGVSSSIHQPEYSNYVRDVFRLSLLRDKHYTHQLRMQAQELIRHSRETFWLGADVVLGIRDDDDDGDDDGCWEGERGSSSWIPQQLCGLEQLACVIFRQHWQHYNLSRYCSGNGDSTRLGAEWWVQVKTVSLPGDENKKESCSSTNVGGGATEAVDLHYDKDEVLAEAFGLGAFPVLSTVTYLTTTATAAAPTVIFSQRYDESATNCISEMMLSHPAPHKHLVFDGRLLHGAPAHFALRREITESLDPTTTTTSTTLCDSVENNNNNDDDNTNQSMRITFLVNIWLNHKPAAVETLPDTIRKALNQVTMIEATSSSNDADAVLWKRSSSLFEGPLPVPKRTLDAAAVLGTDRIELPFVGGKATWGHDDDDDQEEDDAFMVLSTYPPPAPWSLLGRENDSLYVQFGPGYEASLQDPGNYKSDTDDDDDE